MIKRIKGIIGFLEWYRPFIPQLSHKIEQLNKKIKKNSQLIWTKEDTTVVTEILKEIEENTF